jgi:hypothetical protein
MAHTDVTLINDGGFYVPSAASVPVVSGDTISFATSDGSAASLFFSPDAISALSPAPEKAFTLAARASETFKFTKSTKGSYSVFVGSNGDSAPANFPKEVSQSLILVPCSTIQPPPPFNGPGDVLKPGS